MYFFIAIFFFGLIQFVILSYPILILYLRKQEKNKINRSRAEFKNLTCIYIGLSFCK